MDTMHPKWITILSNWIQCYFNGSAGNLKSITPETLLTIIGHLRENISLDESRSSTLEAHTIGEFLSEKYPEFHFSNGSVEPETEDDICIVASLLLYFVCITSKDVSIKNVMCNKLGAEDQETIMKFSKCLLESNHVTREEVQAAIQEACGQELPPSTPYASVAATPPALRSLHGELRRLRAALDAERFDRNYLQEELTRSAQRIEKLAKEKDECKSEIVTLRATISGCCGQRREERAEAGGDAAAKRMAKQLDELEQRLADASAQLDDALSERDAYKAKLEDLKQERNKWFNLSQQEGARATTLSEELEAERRAAEALKEVVAELRLHRTRNCLDASQLECDDPDASVHSAAHNASVCSEACANVIDIQLSEERAKIVVLKQQVQSLQEQIESISKKAEEEKLSLTEILSNNDRDINDLKHRINEEIEEKDGLKSYYNDQCMRLNNEINELEQKIKDNNENSSKAIEQKIEEIKTLQEEKLSLLQSLNDETSKLEGVIKKNEETIHNLQSDLYTERNSKQKLKEDYENQAMKLKEKVLNRNNELVELQNNVFEKSEKIEALQYDIRKANEQKQEITSKFEKEVEQLSILNSDLERDVKEKGEHIQKLNKEHEAKLAAIEQFSVELKELKGINNNLSEQINSLEEAKLKLSEEAQILDENLSKAREELEKLIQVSVDQETSYREMLNERQDTICALQSNLEAEATVKGSLQQEIQQLYAARTEMADELSSLSRECEKLKQAVQEKDRMIDGLDLYVNEEKDANSKLKEQVNNMTIKLKENDDEIRALRDVLDNEMKSHNEDNGHKDDVIKQCQEKIEELMKSINVLEDEKKVLTNDIHDKANYIRMVHEKCAELTAKLKEKESVTQTLEHKLQELQSNYDELQTKYDSETSKLTTRVKETERILKELRSKSNKTIQEKDDELKVLQKTLETTEAAFAEEKQTKAQEIKKLVQEMQIAVDECSNLKTTLDKINLDISAKHNDLANLQDKFDVLLNEKEGLNHELEELKQNLETEIQYKKELQEQKDITNQQLEETLKTVTNNEQCFIEKHNAWEQYKQEMNASIDAKDKQIKEYSNQLLVIENKCEALNSERDGYVKQVEELNKVIEEAKDRYENVLHEKAVLSDQLTEEQAFVEDLQAENQTLSTKYEEVKQELLTEQTQKHKLSEDRDKLLRKIEDLNKQIGHLEEERINLEKQNADLRLTQEKLNTKQSEIEGENNKLKSHLEIVTQQLLEEKSIKDVILHEKDALVLEKQSVIADKEKFMEQLSSEKSVLDALQTEKITLQELNVELNKQLQTITKSFDNAQCNIITLQQEMEVTKNTFAEEQEKLNKNLDILTKECESLKQTILQTENSLVSTKEEFTKKLEERDGTINVLVQEKDRVILEKQDLERTLSTEKASKDLIENEKTLQCNKLQEELNSQSQVINEKTKEIQNLCSELNILKNECDETQAQTIKTTHAVNQGITKLLAALKNENIQNDVLKKLISIENTQLPLNEQCDLLISIAEGLQNEVVTRRNIEKALEHETLAMNEMRQLINQKEMQIHEMQVEMKNLQCSINENKDEQAKKSEAYATSLEEKVRLIQQLQNENQALHAEITDVKLQLELKVHSLKEKLVDNENLTDKLKSTYECQIENLNVMSKKLTDYLKDKAVELEALRKEKEKLQTLVDENNKVIKSQEEEIKSLTQGQEKLMTDFESERLVLKNMVSVTESVMEDQKNGLDQIIADHEKAKMLLQEENDRIKSDFEVQKKELESVLEEKQVAFDALFKDLTEERREKEFVCKNSEDKIKELKELIETKEAEKSGVEKELRELVDSKEQELVSLNEKLNKHKSQQEELQKRLSQKEDELHKVINEKVHLSEELRNLQSQISDKNERIDSLETMVSENETNIGILKAEVDVLNAEKIESTQKLEVLIKLQKENADLACIVEEKKTVIEKLEQQIQMDTEQMQKLRESTNDRENLESRCAMLSEYQDKAEKYLEERNDEVKILEREVLDLKSQVHSLNEQLNEKNEIISTVSKELFEEKSAKEQLRQQLAAEELRKESYKASAQMSGHSRDKKPFGSRSRQVDLSSSDLASSLDSDRTADLERIIHDRNRTITTLQSDIAYIKTLLGESENKLIDVTKDLEVAKETNEQLSTHLKKVVHQKNEEIADLKKQVNKMSATENRASQIIKVSAKYQAIILKRIAEIKSNTVLKELTNFGSNSANENEVRKSIAGSVTMEDLENFLEQTDRHMRRSSEKQLALQKERDRLVEVNRINESEIVGMKKFLTELSVSFNTFISVKDVYMQRLSRVVAVQRTVRREILNLDGRVADSALCKLERSYAAVMQDLAECVMNLERWMERYLSRTISPEKIKQAFTSEVERASIASGTFQNTSLEVQLEELESSFQKVLEEVLRAQKGQPRETQAEASTVQEVRAEYEDKLNRMKAKMKQLYQEQIGIFREKQKVEIEALEKELQKAKDKLAESSRAYEEHIKGLTTELWNVGEKFLVKKEEAEWLRRRGRNPSLMSLQHLPNNATYDEPRQSDAASLRSLPVHNTEKTGRKNAALHMSDEEGEVFDNRWLRDLNETPQTNKRTHRQTHEPQRLSELRWRNSLCPPHLKSSYPAETQFANAVNEDDIKCANASLVGRPSVLRKEVGITAYKKPGPPTPSKQAGRLSATDSELRESLRPEPEPSGTLMRKTTTPSRIRALFFSSKNDTNDGTPRRRLSIFRNKK